MPGGPVAGAVWPHGLQQDVPQRLAALTLPK
jgi:hypothetical protein